MKLPIAILFALLSLLSSCKTEKDRLSNLWFYTHSKGSTLAGDTLLTPVSFLMLNPDGSYTRDFGDFEFGNWTIANEAIVLTNQHNKRHTLSYQLEGIYNIAITRNESEKAYFETPELKESAVASSPYRKELNHWRIPATRKETTQEIRKRLLNHCQFWEAYFAWALENDLKSLDVRSTPTSIKIYGNGFGLKPVDELPATWKQYFFDEEDCLKANAEIEHIFRKENIAWAKTGNKYKMFISAFQQMQQFLK